MNIVFLDSDTLGDDISLDSFKNMGSFISYPLSSQEEAVERIKDCEVLIVNKVIIGKREIDAAPKLKLICVAATGINNIDTAYAQQKGIPVKNAAGYSTESVAQTTFMHILNLVGHGFYFDRSVKSGNYSKGKTFADLSHPFFELKGKNLGIIGLGTIGERVAEIASLFGMHISYYPTSGITHSKKYPALSLDELLIQNDIISIHAPLNANTRYLIRYENLKLMKKQGYILNMGRGGIIHEEELVRALNEDLIAGAAIDVYEKEPVPADSPYFSVNEPDKLILSPHIAWASVESRKMLVEKIAENIREFIKNNIH